jgi:hypothetical protein
MSKYGMGLLQGADLGRRQLIAFAILSAIVNGLVTALVGGWLAQTYSAYQKKTTAIQNIADLVYERRTRAGMVVWAIKRNAELDELRYRKRAYDEAFVAWNTKTQRNVFMIRDVSGQKGVTRLETQFQELLVPGLTATDHCLTKAYDLRLNGGDALPVLEACRMADLHQFTLDCAATFTNEMDRLTRLSFLPWSSNSEADRKAVEARVDKGCANMPAPKPAPELVKAPAANPAASPAIVTPVTDTSTPVTPPAGPASSLAPIPPEAAK